MEPEVEPEVELKAEPDVGPEFEPEVMSPGKIFSTLMEEVESPNSHLSKLRGIPHLVRLIFDLATNESFWKKCIRLPDIDLDAKIAQAFKKRYPDKDILIEDFSFNNKWDLWRGLPEEWDSYLFSTELHQDDLEFPPPKDININMMPFILSPDFEGSKLPDYLRPYWKFIERCGSTETRKVDKLWFSRDSSEIGKVCYLTIQESMVETGTSQRRSGVHVDCPGYVKIRSSLSTEKGSGGGGEEGGGGGGGSVLISEGNKGHGKAKRYRDHCWGLGGCYVAPPQPHMKGMDEDAYLRSFELRGGIFMASSVAESCRAWNCKIVTGAEEKVEEEEVAQKTANIKDNEKNAVKYTTEESPKGDDVEDTTEVAAVYTKDRNIEQKSDKKRYREAIGKHGSVEHLRHLLPKELAQTMKPNRMYWMTDRTPHESLPLKAGTYRQFFRLVMSKVSLWYEDHSTPNPNGVKPDATITNIVRGNKFHMNGVEIVF